MRLRLRIFGRELASFEAEHDTGIRELAAAIGELASLSAVSDDNEEPCHHLDDEDEETKPQFVGRTTDAVIERDDEPHDPTLGWRWDYDESKPGRGTPDARRGFGFGG